jgi:hypothetical protein
MKNLPGIMMSRRAGLAGALIVGAAMLAAPGAASAAEALNCPTWTEKTVTLKTIQDLSAGGGLWTVKSKAGGVQKLHVETFKLTSLSAAWKAAGTLHAVFEGDQLDHPTGYGHFSGEVNLAPKTHDTGGFSLAVVTILWGGMASPGNAPAEQYYFASLSGTFDLNSNIITGTYIDNRGSASGIPSAGEAFVMTKDVPHNCRPVT